MHLWPSLCLCLCCFSLDHPSSSHIPKYILCHPSHHCVPTLELPFLTSSFTSRLDIMHAAFGVLGFKCAQNFSSMKKKAQLAFVIFSTGYLILLH